MSITVYSLLWAMQDLYHQQYFGGSLVWLQSNIPPQILSPKCSTLNLFPAWRVAGPVIHRAISMLQETIIRVLILITS